MDRIKAYEILGLQENAPRYEVEHRYSMLIKLYDSRRKNKESNSQLENIDISMVIEAYQSITEESQIGYSLLHGSKAIAEDNLIGS